jgi:hypothetical protein
MMVGPKSLAAKLRDGRMAQTVALSGYRLLLVTWWDFPVSHPRPAGMGQTPVRERRETDVRENGIAADQLPRLWRKHSHAEFPSRLRGEELAGVDLVTLDSDVVGCVTTYLAAKGSLDEAQKQVLVRSVDHLDAVLPLLASRNESLYFGRLRELSTLILDL